MLLAFDSATEQLAIGLRTAAGDQVRNLPGGASASATLLPTVHALLVQAGIGFADLQAIAFGQGPGAFTGLRTACAVAQGIALGIDKPVLPIDSLLIVADDARQQMLGDKADAADGAVDVIVLMDARMDEVYAARYRWQGGAWAVLVAPALYTLAAVQQLWMATQSTGDQVAGDHDGIGIGIGSESESGTGSGNADGAACALQLVAGSALLVFGPRLALPDALQRVPQEQDRAAALLRLAGHAAAAGADIDAALALPLYLRDKVALTTLEREAVKAAKAGQAAGNPPSQAATHPGVFRQPSMSAQLQQPPQVPALRRAMLPADVEAVLAVEAAAYSHPWTRGNFLDSLSAGYQAQVLLLQAAQRAQLVGYFVAMPGVDELHLLNITVAPAWQGRGHGNALLDAVLGLARQQPAAMLWLEVRHSNHRARALYRRRGFAEVGLRRGYYPAVGGHEDAVVMSLPVMQPGAAHAVD